jgi:hypothetical protein
MASSKSKKNWGDIFSTSKHSQPLAGDKEDKKFSREDSFASFAKNNKYRGMVSEFKLDSDDLIYIEDSDKFLTRLFKRLRNGINQLTQLLKKI